MPLHERTAPFDRPLGYATGGRSATHGLGAVLGEILALRLAEVGDGLVCFFDKEWAAPKTPAEALWTSG